MGAANFTLLDSSLPELGRLISAMLQARDAVERRSWSHPQEPTSEDWWAGVLADPRARKREQRADLAVKRAFYRLADEKHEIILVACSKCDWRAAFARDELIAAHGAEPQAARSKGRRPQLPQPIAAFSGTALLRAKLRGLLRGLFFPYRLSCLYFG